MTTVSVQKQVKTLVGLLMQRPITEAVAQAVEAQPGFEHLDVVGGEWVGFDEDAVMGGEEHGWLEAIIVTLLTQWALANQIGRVYPGDTDFVLDGTPDDIRLKRRPDVAFVRTEKVKPTQGYIYAAPDLAVEIISPSERPAQIRQKLNEYLQHGTQQVWQVYPDNREIVVHLPDRTAKTYPVGDTIPGGDLLPGFTLDVAQVFET